MKLHFLGTAADMEPMHEVHAQTLAIEVNNSIYFFDVGDAAERSMKFMGLDFLKINKIIISHPHMGHVGGLGYLLFMMRKEKGWQKKEPECGVPAVYVPDIRIWQGYKEGILIGTEEGFSGFELYAKEFYDGVVFQDDNMKVTAYHNNHMGIPKDGRWRSFSFVIEAEDKRLIYTGDISDYNEIIPLIGNGCDIIFAETGRHDYRKVCKILSGRNVKNLLFTHNSKELMQSVDAAVTIQDLFDGNALICKDRSSIII